MNVQVMSESILGVQIVEENRRVPVIGGGLPARYAVAGADSGGQITLVAV